jgi:hypothetical protein
VFDWLNSFPYNRTQRRCHILKFYSVCLFWRNCRVGGGEKGGKNFPCFLVRARVRITLSWPWCLSTHNDRPFPLPVGITAGNSFDVPSVVGILQYAVTMRHYFVRCNDNQSHSLVLHDRVWILKRFHSQVSCVFFQLCASFMCQAIEACPRTGLRWRTFEYCISCKATVSRLMCLTNASVTLQAQGAK